MMADKEYCPLPQDPTSEEEESYSQSQTQRILWTHRKYTSFLVLALTLSAILNILSAIYIWLREPTSIQERRTPYGIVLLF